MHLDAVTNFPQFQCAVHGMRCSVDAQKAAISLLLYQIQRYFWGQVQKLNLDNAAEN